jgi:hypothetical protein
MKNAISIRTAVGLGAILCLGLAMPGMAKSPGGGGGGSTSCGYNVTTTIADTDVSFNSLPFQIQSDDYNGSEIYTNATGVTSQIMKGCDWVLNLFNQTTPTRTVKLTFDYPLGSNSAPFHGTEAFAGGIVSNCQKDNDNTVNFGTMTSGQTLTCPMEVDFNYSGSSYHLLMDPNNFSGSTRVQVACTSGTSGDRLPCTAWAVAPIPNSTTNLGTSPEGQPAAIGDLLEDVTSGKGKVTQTNWGLYYVAFGFTISK